MNQFGSSFRKQYQWAVTSLVNPVGAKPSTAPYVSGTQAAARPAGTAKDGSAVRYNPGRTGAGSGTAVRHSADYAVSNPSNTASGTDVKEAATPVGPAATARAISMENKPVADGAALPVKEQQPRKNSENTGNTRFSLNLSDESLLNGFILAEVLGKPRCFRKGR